MYSTSSLLQPPLTRVGIVVPAKNEAAALPRCLHALANAAERIHVPVHVVVVLDDCTDTSADSITAVRPMLGAGLSMTVDTLTVPFSNVGAARSAGVQLVLDRWGTTAVWLANTDADSQVPEHWLRRQLAYANAGAEAVAGTITVEDWRDRPQTVIDRARAEYSSGGDARNSGHGHEHVHGANLGVRSDSYVAVGGFPSLRVHEDVALVAALTATGRRVAWATDLTVTTSARRHARTSGGFATYLNALEYLPDSGAGARCCTRHRLAVEQSEHSGDTPAVRAQ